MGLQQIGGGSGGGGGGVLPDTDATLKSLGLSPDGAVGLSVFEGETARLSLKKAGRFTTNCADEYAAFEFLNSARGIGYYSASDRMLFYCNALGGVNAMVYGGGFLLPASQHLAWTSGNWLAALDLVLCRAASAKLQIGANHATAATLQTIKSHDVTGASGTGAGLLLEGGDGPDGKGAVTLYGRHRLFASSGEPTASEILVVLMNHGIAVANTPSVSITNISYDGADFVFEAIGYDVGVRGQIEISSNGGATWTPYGTVTLDSMSQVTITLTGLGSETFYDVRYRVLSPNNDEAYGAWSTTSFTTAAP